MGADGIGASVKRKEDLRFLTGKGTYVDDLQRPGQVYAKIVRSPVAHAKIASIDIEDAKSAPGVVAIFTGADMAADEVGGLPCGWQLHNKDGSPMAEPAHPPLVVSKVRHVGDQVAVVIAETRDQAREAAMLVEVRLRRPRNHPDGPVSGASGFRVGGLACLSPSWGSRGAA